MCLVLSLKALIKIYATFCYDLESQVFAQLQLFCMSKDLYVLQQHCLPYGVQLPY